MKSLIDRLQNKSRPKRDSGSSNRGDSSEGAKRVRSGVESVVDRDRIRGRVENRFVDREQSSVELERDQQRRPITDRRSLSTTAAQSIDQSLTSAVSNRIKFRSKAKLLMKKSIGRMVKMPYFAGAFGRQCRTDDDKVRLLSVVSRSSLSDDNAPLLVDDDDSTTTSSDSSIGGGGGGSSISELDEEDNNDEVLHLENVVVNAIKVKGSNNGGGKTRSIDERPSTSNGVSTTGATTTYFNGINSKSSSSSSNGQLIDVIETNATDGTTAETTATTSRLHHQQASSKAGGGNSTTTGAGATCTQKGEDEKRHEWVFTLYDFDGKGTPNKEDILSIVRAIYDVLGNARIRARTTSKPNSSENNNNNDSNNERAKNGKSMDEKGGGEGGGNHRATFGAFKIKLSLTADENADVAVTRARKNDESRMVERRRYKRQEKASSTWLVEGGGGKMKGQTQQPVSSNETAGGNKPSMPSGGDTHHSSSLERARNEEELPLLRHHKKPTKRRGGGNNGGTTAANGGAIGGLERHSPPPLHLRKIYRRSASFSQQQPLPPMNNNNSMDPAPFDQQHQQQQQHDSIEPQCSTCTYRDYVNLSELENCCSGGGHHDQQRHARGGIHHIRHCDRHCHCPPTTIAAAAADGSPRHSMENTTAGVAGACFRFGEAAVNHHGKSRNAGGLFVDGGGDGGLCFLHHQSPNTAVVRRCADLIHNHHHHQGVSSSPVTRNNICCHRPFDPLVSNYGAAPSTTSMHVNVQARAYYQDRTAHHQQTKSAQQQPTTKRLSSIGCDQQQENTINVGQQATPMPGSDKKAQPHRPVKEKTTRSNEHVKSWILNDSTNGGEEFSTPPRVNGGTTTVNNAKVETRGVADGSDRVFVEHKHVHKHNHYHHYFY